MPDAFAIKASQLTRRFGHLTAVDHIELGVPYGEIFGLLGANGAWKSTLIKMLPPTSGSAEVGGFDIVAAPGEVRRRIGYVSQLLSADGALTGYENLLLSARLYGLSREERSVRIGDALDFMGLADAARKLVRTYSGGMIRRLELAQAMLHRPAILFLDEPNRQAPGLRIQRSWRTAAPDHETAIRHDRFPHPCPLPKGRGVYGYGVDFTVMLSVFAVLPFIAVSLYPTLAE